VRVTGHIEHVSQAKQQVWLDGHSPSFALQTVKRCLLQRLRRWAGSASQLSAKAKTDTNWCPFRFGAGNRT